MIRRSANRAIALVPFPGLAVIAAMLAFNMVTPAGNAGAQIPDAGFACSKATQPVERLVCARADLRWQDWDMARQYQHAMVEISDAATRLALRDDQRHWLQVRDRTCIGTTTAAELLRPNGKAGDDAAACLEPFYIERRRLLQDIGSPPLPPLAITAIDLKPLRKARPKLADAPGLPVAQATFSPGGGLLALSTPSLELDSADQLWLYDVAGKRLTPASPAPDLNKPHPRDTVSSIRVIAWEGDSHLFARLSLWGDTSATVTVEASMEGYKRLSAPPSWVTELLDAVPLFPNAVPGSEIPAAYRDAPQAVQGNSRFIVWADDRSRGAVELKMRKRGSDAPGDVVAWGSWELAHFLFDADRSQLIHAADTGIVQFDLAGRVSRRIGGTSRGDIPMAVSADGHRLVWSSRRPCGAESLAPPDEAAHAYLCIAELPDEPAPQR